VVILSVLGVGCVLRRPIPLGFAGELTGRRAELGVDGRDGALLAVETLNEAGGIAGRPIELMVRDDRGTLEGAQDAARQLIAADVVAIVGHMTSEQTLAAYPVTEAAGMLLFSPTASTPDLSGRDDHFFRINPTNSLAAQVLARHVIQDRGLSRVAVILDTDNAAYARSYRDAFVETVGDIGGLVVAEASFSSADESDYESLLMELHAADPEGLLIIAAPFDTALIAQRIRIEGWTWPLFASGWAETETLLRNGGSAVEGIEILMNYDSNSQAPAFLDFAARFEGRFGRQPTFAAAQAYETVMALAEGLERTGGEAAGLPQALLDIGTFDGLSSTIHLDPFGDVVRTLFLTVVRDGNFVTVASIEPEEVR
jgi:branched-chain amino acid transport system substrate-binding protein